MMRSLLDFGNAHVLRPLDLALVRWSRVPQRTPGRRVAFFHPPKCGGTSVRKALISALGQPAGLDPIAADAAARSIDVGIAAEREAILAYFVQRQDVRFICGHFAYSRRAFAGHEHEFDLVTILRNPISRVLSRFYFQSEAPDHAPIECADLASWLLTDQARRAALVFTRMFVGDDREEYLGGDSIPAAAPAEAAQQAIENLHRFAIVGTLEHVQAFENILRLRYGVRRRIGHARSNPDYPRYAQQPPAIQRRLCELCREDMMIFEAFNATMMIAV